LIADIPGLIEGASEGKGLGDAFLRHVERTSVLLHLIDAYTDDIAAAYKTIRAELASYSAELVTRPEVVALTKVEGLDEDMIAMQMDAVRAVAGKDAKLFALSAVAHKGITEVLRELRSEVATLKQTETVEDEEDSDLPVITLSNTERERAWSVDVTEEGGHAVYVVTGDKIEKFARRTNFDNFEGVNRLRDIMKKMGISHELSRKGAAGESTIRIGEDTFTFVEQ
jgi:GTP-binding protein